MGKNKMVYKNLKSIREEYEGIFVDSDGNKYTVSYHVYTTKPNGEKSAEIIEILDEDNEWVRNNSRLQTAIRRSITI